MLDTFEIESAARYRRARLSTTARAQRISYSLDEFLNDAVVRTCTLILFGNVGSLCF